MTDVELLKPVVQQQVIREKKLAIIEGTSSIALEAKWNSAEWEYEYVGQPLFADVDDYLKALCPDMVDAEKMDAFRAAVHASMVQVLQRLQENQIVSNHDDTTPIVMYALIYDSCDTEPLLRRSATLLNQPEAVSELLAALGDEP